MAALLAGPASSLAATVDVVASEDAYVDSSTPTTNYGGVPMLAAEGSPVATTYLKFRMPDGPFTLVKAELKVTTGSPATVARQVRGVGYEWAENTLVYQGAPPPNSTVLGMFRQATFAGRVTVNVTSHVSSCWPGTDCALAITTTDATRVSIKSRESASGKPTLTLTT